MNEKLGIHHGFFVISVRQDSKQLVSSLYGAIFQFYAEKSLKMRRMQTLAKSLPLHPVRCPVNAMFF